MTKINQNELKIRKSIGWKNLLLLCVILLIVMPIPLELMGGLVWEHFFRHDPPPLADVKADSFSFEDYTPKHRSELGSALIKIFPIGTSKAYIDNILVGKAGATIREEQTKRPEAPYWAAYTHRTASFYILFPDCAPIWQVIARYDANFKLIEMFSNDWARCAF